MTAEDEGFLNTFSEIVLKQTKGHPIMVKFYFLRRGLRTDVERRYTDYLSGDSRKIQTTLACSLLHIGNQPITDAFLEGIGLLREAYKLEHAILYQPSKGIWETIHPRWDEEMLSFLYNESDLGRLYDNKQHLKTALDYIFNLTEKDTSATQKRAYSVIGTIYDLGARGVIPIDIIESVISIPPYLTNEKKAELYTYYIAEAYDKLGKSKDRKIGCRLDL
jgi:hypothetical protein